MLQVGYIIHMGVIDSIEKKGSEVISDHLAKIFRHFPGRQKT